MLINLWGSQTHSSQFPLSWALLNSNLILVNSTYYIFEDLFPNFSHCASWHKNAQCFCIMLCARQEGGGKNPVCMLLPGRALQGFGAECVTVHVCVYLGEITMGGCVFTPHGKNHFVDCVENQCHVSFSAWLHGAPRWSVCSTWRRSDSTSNPSSASLTLAPVLTWFSPPFRSSVLHHCLLCPLVLLSDFPVLLTETECHTICHGMLRQGVGGFISVALGIDCGPVWLALSKHTQLE